jgi:hypothetical protein
MEGGSRASFGTDLRRGAAMGSVIKKRRKKMRKHKYKKLRARMRHKRKRGK